MWFPSPDILVYSGLALAALWPAMRSAVGFVRSLAGGPVRPDALPPDRWQSDSIATLVALQSELADRKMPQAMKLCRELCWEILGGDSVA